MEILASGGNAMDAAVAAALVGCVVNVSKCGIGGYGGHLVVGLPDGTAAAIDFNSTAPAAARADMFPLDKNGSVKGHIHEARLACRRRTGHARRNATRTRKIRNALVEANPAAGHPMGSRRLPAHHAIPVLSQRQAPKERRMVRNPELADMLQQLADSGSAEPFYRGQIGEHIAHAFQKNGGLVTADDMARYHAHVVPPLTLEWRGYTIATAPLTAGGLTVLQAIASLKAFEWDAVSSDDPAKTHAWIEALRIAWGDRLALLGDPSHADVPVERLLSEQYAHQSAEKIKRAIAERRPVPIATDSRTADGTFHVSAMDSAA